MSPDIKQIVIARAKSFGWRLGCVIIIAGLGYISQNLTGFGLPTAVIGVLGLLLSEVTKYVNDHVGIFGAARKG